MRLHSIQLTILRSELNGGFFLSISSTQFFKASSWVWLHLLDLGRRLASKAWFCRGDDGEMRWDDVQVVSFKWLVWRDII